MQPAMARPSDPAARRDLDAAIRGHPLLDGSRLETERQFTPIKRLGSGTFGSVFVADWHSALPNGALVPAMQHSYARPAYVGKRIVAIKRMKRTYTTWEDCLSLNELHALLVLPPQEHIVALYDVFRKPMSDELYIVFESMEGNLYQLIRSRKGQPMAPGLIGSIAEQVFSGIHHIHSHGFFHRDMKPENVLITTTGLGEYPVADGSGMTSRQDVLVLAKIADFGLARRLDSAPPYTEYVSTRWYRAPEILLRDPAYSASVDIWAMGTILAEMVSLEPLFPGCNDLDQLQRIISVQGTPCHTPAARNDESVLLGGGAWPQGLALAEHWQISLHDVAPVPLASVLPASIHPLLLDLIFGMLRYDPAARLSARDCLHHPYVQREVPQWQPTLRLVPEPCVNVSPADLLDSPMGSPRVHRSASHPRLGASSALDVDTVPMSPPICQISPPKDSLDWPDTNSLSAPYSPVRAIKQGEGSPQHSQKWPLHGMAKPSLRASSARLLGHIFSASHPASPAPSDGSWQDTTSNASVTTTGSAPGQDEPLASYGTPPPPAATDDLGTEQLSRLASTPPSAGSHFLRLRRSRRDMAQESRTAARKRREDEMMVMRERSRAVLNKRDHIMKQTDASAPKGWVNYGF